MRGNAGRKSGFVRGGPMARLEPRPTKHPGRARLQPSRGAFNARHGAGL